MNFAMKKIIVLAWIIVLTLPAQSQDVVDHLLRARALFSAGTPDLAITELTEVLITAKDYRLYLERAEANALKGDYSAAIGDYNEANKLSHASGEYGLSRIYALKGDIQTAIYHLEMNLNSQWKKSEKEILLDPAFGVVENRTEWRTFWRKDRYSEMERKVSEIEFYTSAGKTGDAVVILSEIKKNYPGTDDVLYSEALISFASGKPAEAVKALSRLTDLYPKNEKYLRTLARAQEAASNPAGASVTYTRLLEAGIADAGLLLSRAQSYRRTGENEKALQDINKYLGYYPGNKEALSFAGKTEAVTGDNLKAIELFSKNLELHPSDADCYVDRGNSYLVAKSWDWAIKDYSMSLDLKPGNPDAWLNKGIALLNSGRKTDACHDFRKALSMGNKRASEFISRNCIK